jgi:hypothetical protein
MTQLWLIYTFDITIYTMATFPSTHITLEISPISLTGSFVRSCHSSTTISIQLSSTGMALSLIRSTWHQYWGSIGFPREKDLSLCAIKPFKCVHRMEETHACHHVRFASSRWISKCGSIRAFISCPPHGQIRRGPLSIASGRYDGHVGGLTCRH